MKIRNWEDWAIALPFVGATALGLAFSGAQAPSFATIAVAAEQHAPNYTITITANRLPAECKIAGAKPAHCAHADDATMSIRANN